MFFISSSKFSAISSSGITYDPFILLSLALWLNILKKDFLTLSLVILYYIPWPIFQLTKYSIKLLSLPSI